MRPFRYGLIDEETDEDEWLGRCLDIHGLFVDLPGPRLARLTLTGCEPDGLLRDALDSPVPVRLGDIYVDGGDEPGQVWPLRDATVLGRVAESADVEVEARLDQFDEPPARLLSQFRLFREPGDALGSCESVDGLFTQWQPDPSGPMTLYGVEPHNRLLRLLDRGRPVPVGQARIVFLDQQGRQFDPTWMTSVQVVSAVASTAGAGLVDLVVANGVSRPPPRVARSIWDMWFTGGPPEKNMWAGYDTDGRKAWTLAAVSRPRDPAKDTPPGATFHIDGRFVTDVAGFACAIGEAVNGPGGYFGWGIDQSTTECLQGTFGATPPFTLVWHDSDTSRTQLRLAAERELLRYDPFETIVDMIRDHVTLELE